MEPFGFGYLRDESGFHNFAFVVYRLWCLKDLAPYQANMLSLLMAAIFRKLPTGPHGGQALGGRLGEGKRKGN